MQIRGFLNRRRKRIVGEFNFAPLQGKMGMKILGMEMGL
jgi:hypothetical protein